MGQNAEHQGRKDKIIVGVADGREGQERCGMAGLVPV